MMWKILAERAKDFMDSTRGYSHVRAWWNMWMMFLWRFIQEWLISVSWSIQDLAKSIRESRNNNININIVDWKVVDEEIGENTED